MFIDSPSGFFLVPSTSQVSHLVEWHLKCGLPPSFQRETQVQACFIPPRPTDVQMLDGGGSDTHIITFARTYMTQMMDGVIQVVTKEPAALGHHSTQTHRDAQPKRRRYRRQGRSQPQCPQSVPAPEFSLLLVGAVTGKKGLGPEAPHVMMGACFRGNFWERPSSWSPGMPSAGHKGLAQLRKGGLLPGWRPRGI